MEGTIGQIILFGGNYAPDGWAFCQGQIIQVNDYQALFAILGNIYGGDGDKTFALPNLCGRSAVGAGPGMGIGGRKPSTYGLGQTAGVETVTLNESHLPAHSHKFTLQANDGAAATDKAAGGYLAKTVSNLYADSSDGTKMAVQTTDLSAGGDKFSVIQPSLGVNYIICTMGIFPV